MVQEFEGKKFLVTGAAGFIGSHLSETLLELGAEVLGVDRLSDYYSTSLKRSYLNDLEVDPKFDFLEADLRELDYGDIIPGLDAVFHQAAQAGVRSSWGGEFDVYVSDNVKSTQVLLEQIKKRAPGLPLIMASSSSVYGIPDSLPMHESMRQKPYSPYGVTKLAAENLALLYGQNYNLKVAPLRYFTVFGPRQRPDMAFTRFLTWIYNDQPITVFGDGTQTRDFTYVADAVEANLEVYRKKAYGRVYNVGGGTRVSLNDLFEVLKGVTERDFKLEYEPEQKGDVPHTAADTRALQTSTGWEPKVELTEGLKRQWEWVRETGLARQAVER